MVAVSVVLPTYRRPQVLRRAVASDSNVHSNPAGDVRPRSHNHAPNQARSGPALPRERCGAPSAAFERQCGLPHAPNGSILAMEPALSEKMSA